MKIQTLDQFDEWLAHHSLTRVLACNLCIMTYDQLRNLFDKRCLSPLPSRYRLFLLTDANTLSIEELEQYEREKKRDALQQKAEIIASHFILQWKQTGEQPTYILNRTSTSYRKFADYVEEMSTRLMGSNRKEIASMDKMLKGMLQQPVEFSEAELQYAVQQLIAAKQQFLGLLQGSLGNHQRVKQLMGSELSEFIQIMNFFAQDDPKQAVQQYLQRRTFF